MCAVLQIARSTFYYEPKEQPKEENLMEAIVDIFHKNQKPTAPVRSKSSFRIKASAFLDARLAGS